ncbi:MAG: hypothetical protein AB8G05_10900 [Oligoflexales bacterium]
MNRYFILLILSAGLIISTGALAGKVEICKHYISKKQHRCIIKQLDDDVVKVGSQVVLYSDDFHWIATGDVVVKKGELSIAIFKDAGPNVSRGLNAVFEDSSSKNTLDYDLAFDKLDY